MDVPIFERSALEADMKLLATEIENQRRRPEMKDAGGKQILKEALRVFPNAKEQAPGNPATQQPSNPATQSSSSPLPAYAQSAPAEVKLEIEYLIDLALRKGIGAAFAQAGKSTAFVQDAFHDALAGRLYPELKKEGIVD